MASLDAEQASKIAEISGWDTDENFFVEKAVLHRHRDGGNKKVDLRARLRVGSLVFVRLSEASLDRTVPVTYQVSGVKGNAKNRAREVRLTRLPPKETVATTLLEFTFRETAPN